MTPFYESKAEVDVKPQVVIYNARWEDVWPTLGLSPKDVALCWADPPYGIRVNTKRGTKPRPGGALPKGGKNWAPVAGDDVPFAPEALLIFPRLVSWGANHYASRMPDSPSWWLWDKREGIIPERSQADGEAAWTNVGGPLRIFRYFWDGLAQREKDTAGGIRLHPTMKPVALAEWGFQRAGLKPGDLVFAPYLGSGPEVRAALNLGLRIIGCEVDADYCRTVVEHRVALAAPKRGQEGQRLLFGDAP